ncbi:MAG: hypothetical protein AMXMBFR81_21690 [Chthonomonas sp.]
MLWLMRRPPIKRTRRWVVVHAPRPIAESIVRQDRLALRVGERLLTVVFHVVLLSLLVQACYVAVVHLAATGALGADTLGRGTP